MSVPADPPGSNAPFGHSIFCEDIRNEIGDKFTYVGVVSGVIALESFPALLPKFAVAITYNQPRNKYRKSTNLKILFAPDGGDEENPVILFDTNLDIPDGSEILKPENGILSAEARLVISPLQLAGPGRVKVRAYFPDQQPVMLGSIQFRQSDQG